MKAFPVLYTAASGARFGGISVATFNKRVAALLIEACAHLAFGRTKQPLYHVSDVMKIVGPYVVARDLEKFPDVATAATATAVREAMKSEQEQAVAETDAHWVALEAQRKAQLAGNLMMRAITAQPSNATAAKTK